jgi:hypothetical protein
MAVEASDVTVDLVVEVDPIPAGYAVIAIDPIEEPIELAIVEPEVPPAGDGPDAFATDEPKVIIDDNLMVPDPGSPIDVQPEDEPTDASVDATTDSGTDDGTLVTTMIVDEPPVDEALVDGAPADDGSETPVDGGGDGDIFITYVGEEYTGEESSGEEFIGRPVDPQPEWRTIDGDGSGEGEEGSDIGGGESSGGEGMVGEGGGGDDGLIFTTMIIDEAPTDGVPADDGSEAPVEGGGDGDIFITYVGEEYTGEESSGEETPGEEFIGRPVDPMPEWRTFDGDGSSEGEEASEVGGGEGFVGEGGGDDGLIVIDKDILVDDTGFVVDETGSGSDGSDEGAGAGDPAPDKGLEIPDDVIYTMNPDDLPVYACHGGLGATTTALDDTPGRPTDPLPYERNNVAPAIDPAAPETASDVVHYAASEPFHTGLDLL